MISMANLMFVVQILIATNVMVLEQLLMTRIPPPTVDDYRPGGRFYASVLASLEKSSVPYGEHMFLEVAKRMPFFQALIEEIRRRSDHSV